nr:MAG TPA: tail protein [Caudoviricetes sp.]
MIQIKRNNKVFFTLEDFGEGSKLSYQLMDHHYIILKFTTATPIYFEIGDSVDIPDFGYFELTSSYFPKHNDSDGYDYEMQMDAYYMSWKNKICKYRPQHGANETSFKLTTTVGVHMNVILGNLKALGLTYNGKDFSVDYTTYNNKAFDVQKRFLIEYGSISILDALNSICSEDALNCEWWIDGSIIYLGYCEMEGQTTFEQDVNVLSMSYSESKSTYITRLYAFGSDRNIPKGYFTGVDADVTTDGVATDYLMLPNKEVDSDGFYAKDGYIENVNVVKNDKQAIEGVVMFEDEYPKVESAVSSIKTYDSTVDNEDGTKTTQTFWQVTSTDSFTNSFKESWIKSNLTLGIKFTSGALMGMVFDVSFKVIDKVNYFEIVANDTYGRTLPDGVMCPKVGDKYFLFNWDATKITDTDLIPAAQLSLFDRAKQYYLKTMISNANFTCTMDGDKFYNNGTYDYHPLGEQVKLINDMFAQVDAKGKHYRNSRIIGMEIPLDIPYDHPQYIVGEKAATSRLGKLEDKVDSITVNGIQISGGNGGGGVYVIGMNDSTPPTDSNVLSARKTILSFLSKLHNDTAQGLITFAKGLIAKGLADLMMGAKFGNNAKITELGDAVFNTIKSFDYDNAAEQGFSVEKEKNGKYHAFLNNLTIWGKAIFHELDVRKLSYSGGNIYLSGAGSKLIKVVPVKESVSADGVISWVETTADDAECAGWKCYLLADNGTTATMNYWQEGDQVRCQTIGEIVAGGAYSDTSNKSYWRTILDGGVSTQNEKIYGTKTETYLDEAGKEQTREVQVELYDGQAFAWIVVGKHSEGLDGYTEKNAPVEIKGDPAEGDTIVLDGNRHRNGNLEYDKTDRQNVIILETTGDYAPRIACYANISEYKHTITKSVNGENKEVSLSVFETSPKGGTKINSSHFELVSDDGSTINIINYRGDWVEGNTYHKNDQVNHNNAVWVCVANSEEDVTGEPSDGSTQWKKVLSGSKGEKGDKGDRGDEGPQGPKGETGAHGETGAQGPQGEKGEQGTPGADGTNGEDGVSILLVQPIVLDTNDNGIVSDTTAEGRVKVMRGGENVTNECSDVRVSYMQNCTAAASLATGYIKVKLNSVNTTTLASGDKVSVSEGFITIAFSLGGKSYSTQVPFSVNVSKYMGSVKATAKQYQSQFEKLENDLKGSNPTVLKAYTSTIKQAAREISLSVSEKSIGRRNLLVGSAFLREDNNCTISKDARIEINSGYQGTNCIHVIDATEAGNPHCVGAYWDGSQGGRSIKIEKGKKYTMSCFYKTNDINGEFYLEAIYTDKQENATRKGQAKYLSPNRHTVKKVNEWELFTTVVDTTDAEYDYIAFNFWEACNVIAGQINAWICRPMVEEGDTYNGWTLSQNDYDYVGGNLLEDTMALTRSSDKSNLQFASGLILFGKYEGCYGILYNKNNSAESQFTEALQYKFPTTATLSGQARIVKNQDYVFSFVAKGSGNINVYLYGDSVHANVFTETCEGNVYPVGWADGYTQLALTSTYKRYWVHWRINDYTGEGAEVIPDKVLIRVPGDTEAWVTKPKLEEGAQLTDYTERKTDLIDRATAKAAGLEITSSGVTLYGEKIKVENTLSTGQTTTAALFKDGAINAALILAQMLTSQGHNGQMVRIADGLINIYGKAGTANIRFGLNSSGQAVLSYYDDNGNFLYDLGPSGIASMSKTNAKITSKQYIKAEDAGLTTPIGENVDLPWANTTKSWYTATKDNNYILFIKGATGKTTTLYTYSAPKVNGKVVADSANGLDTYDLASAADGRTFTSRTMVKNGALTNLADGVFLTADAKVYDNTKLVPAIKKGQSVTRPSFYVQIASFNAKFTTLGLLGKIYSIQTEITFGNLDVGIMSNNNY